MTTLTVNKPAPQASRWPYAIVATFVLFALFIGCMVRQAMSTKVDLVSKDYYQQELTHQQRMDAVARTNALPAQVSIAHDASSRQLTLQLPAPLTGQAATGQVQFFRPSDQTLDFTVPFQADATGTQRLSTTRLKPGYWRIRLDLVAGGQAYFVEQNISISN